MAYDDVAQLRREVEALRRELGYVRDDVGELVRDRDRLRRELHNVSTDLTDLTVRLAGMVRG